MICTALAVLLLTSCSDGDDDPEPAASDQAAVVETEAVAEPSVEPAYAEADTCRTKMLPLQEIMMASAADGLQYNRFTDRVEELERLIDRALLVCSDALNRAARKVMFEFSMARAQWGLCDADDCMDDVTQSLTKGLLSASRVGELLGRQV